MTLLFPVLNAPEHTEHIFDTVAPQSLSPGGWNPRVPPPCPLLVNETLVHVIKCMHRDFLRYLE